MKIKSTLTNHAGEVLEVIYHDIENEQELGDKKIQSIHAYCFYKDKLIVVYAANKGYWAPAGGGIEVNESIRDAVAREVKEEANMRTRTQRLIGCQDIFEPQRIVSQTRSVCLVEPYSDFIADPDGDITEIKLIDPKDYKQYFDWGIIGDHIMKRALQIKEQMDSRIG